MDMHDYFAQLDLAITETLMRTHNTLHMDPLCAARCSADCPGLPLLHEQALKDNAQIVYVYGHGTRAYVLTDVTLYDNGDFIYIVRPVSGGMKWTYYNRPFSTKPFTSYAMRMADHEAWHRNFEISGCICADDCPGLLADHEEALAMNKI